MIRRLLPALAGLLGVVLIGADARWVGADAASFRVSLFGADLWSGDRPALAGLVDSLRPWLLGLGGATSLLLAGCFVRRLALGGIAATLLFAAALFCLFDPGTLEFVTLRRAESAFRYLDVGDGLRALGWGLVGCGGLALLAQPASGPSPAERSSALPVVLACAAALVLPPALAFGFLSGEPLTNDGVAYRFQAELFAEGGLVRDVGDLAEFFPARQVMPGPEAFSKYPPGHSAVLAVGQAFGWPRLLPFLLAALVPWLTFLLARRLGSAAPHRAALLVALSPMFLGVEALWLSHATSLPAGLVFVLTSVLVATAPVPSAKRAALLGVLGGLALGLAFTARPLTAVALAPPFLIVLVLARGPGLAYLAGAAVGFAPLALGFLWINAELTGSAWTTAYGAYAELVSPNDRWGLANAATALPHTRYNLTRAATWLHGAAPGTWLVILGVLATRRARGTALLWTPAALLLAAYALHRFHGIPWVGPLYLVEALPLLAVLSARGWEALEARFGSAAPRALVLAAALGSAQLLANHFSLAAEHVNERTAPRRIAREQGVETGVVFVPIRSERELRNHPLPPPAASAELVFARDLGDRNDELRRRLGDPPAWRFDPDRRVLVPLD